jgi:hypothetical protein
LKIRKGIIVAEIVDGSIAGADMLKDEKKN